MSTVFISGDRSLNPVTAANAALAIIGQLAQIDPEVQIATGSLDSGIERAVRYFLPDATEVPHLLTDEGFIDFDERHKRVANEFDAVVFIHGDALSSRIGKSLVATVPAEKLTFV